MTAAPIKTLANLTEQYRLRGGSETRTRDQFVLFTEYAVGRAGRALRGSHAHVLIIETIIADTSATPGRFPNGQRALTTGDVFSAHPLCHGNYGQHGAQRIAGVDTDAVTCSKCRRAIEL